MKTIKKSVFAILMLAGIGIFAVKWTSDTVVNELLNQNIEALALEDEQNKDWLEHFAARYIPLYHPEVGAVVDTRCCLPSFLSDACCVASTGCAILPPML